ncbi:putative 1,4-beta-D-glucan cellobiohydrolase B [Psilocybe cubensis]|uniref:1,4-beta-D-glucan cellobiohydrolase B n=2 Tax=Psilocybe cubensis TaxID=181762 RepID=A0ACB8GLD3_PSICU|nr:putative 1,4-beta-D-glucan cellobiohydrolase B [Psilocybe cubensis]KAH9476508.1 putative 1,4-beta-D-glucan cellobiohydrolase B [Psilocybe cubensis]
MFPKTALLALTFGSVALGQLVGTYQAENHPALPFQRCTRSGCTTVSSGQVVLDSNWRWTHNKDGYTNCYTGNTWNTTICPDNKSCAANCAIDGADYSETYGITVSGNALTLKFVTTNANGKNIGSRVYLMNSDSKYELFKVLNQEFTFDVDVSNLPCGLNGALYFSEMDADGGLSKHPTNKAGAKYGTGYCDSQCPKDIKWISGEANAEGWTPSDSDANAGNGKYGTCCNEMDIWEANSISAAYTPHPCTKTGPYRCSGTECNTPTDRYGGICDPDGCDFNSYRQGDRTFYGPGLTVDTKKKFTVVTQFITSDGTSSGSLKEIRRIYVQDGKVIQNSKSTIAGVSGYDSITEQFCTDQKVAFGDTDSFKAKGGMAGMEAGLRNGMVLALSIWDDHHANMLWLDSTYPVDSTSPGAQRGSCPTTSGDPKDVEANSPNASVTYSNIKIGDIGTTYTGGSSGTTIGGGTTTTTSTAPGPTQTKYGQCGGIGWSGPTVCAPGSTCQSSNPFYSQCL